ncbi:g9922 [Coccomyxa viridis]|uniref:G9922 protein n=1 Tax=Coccomyxa viridis TaxID=1274662 RepID=A0ABP1G8Q1_9CHLO
MLIAARRGLEVVLVLAFLVKSTAANDVDLPVAIQGTEQWAGVVAKAMTVDRRSLAESLQALKIFQSSVMQKTAKTAAALHNTEDGDISGILAQAMKKAVSISAPTFFATNTDLFQDSVAAIQFGFAGLVVAPCAVPVVPIGVGIFPQGISIQPVGVDIAPTGVNITPQGVNIAPVLIVVGPYDTTVAGQGLNIAPALIAVAPVKEIVNPVGPLAITDTLVSATVPALP